MLSRERYAAVLDQAKAPGFAFVRFQDFLPRAPVLPQRYIALRHDVDFAPEYSLELAELVGHGAHVQRSASVTGGVILSGSAVVGEEAWLGVNTSVRDGRRVGSHALVGMDASVQEDLKDGAIAHAPRPDVSERAADDDLDSIGFAYRRKR